jgi:signal transduction histidine kinase
MDLSAYTFSVMQDGPLTLYLGIGDGLAPVLLATPAGEVPSPGSLRRLEHAFALKDALSPDWAARPVALAIRNGRLTLVLEDPGGVPLDGLLDRPMDVTHFLRIAIPLSAAVGQMHAHGLIHKDLKPANILVDAASGGVWLTGFGIASRLPREHGVPAPPEVNAGTLAYIAPEQTRRMNSSVDSRSDLYALGVTFYKMLTGTLPFIAADPMERVHSHIARQPVPPAELLADIPEPLSAIVTKLLAKIAEDRYQTAVAVASDLRRCLVEFETSGHIAPFPLGMQDASRRLLITEKLYGRECEVEASLASIDTVIKALQAVSSEINLESLIKTFMVIAVEHAGAGRGLLVLPREGQLWVEAEATAGASTVEVNLRRALVASSELPDSVLQYVSRTQEPVILYDGSNDELFLADDYTIQRRPRSLLCLPLVKQAELIGVLYLENNQASHVFTPARVAVLKLLSSQAAISLQNAHLYAELIAENRERQKAEEALRASEAALSEAQKISHTGSWRWKVRAGECYLSAEFLRIYALDPTTEPLSYATVMDRIHGEDRPLFEQALDGAVRERSWFQHEYRVALPDGSVKHLVCVGQPDLTESGEIEFVGTVMDITERRRAEEALRDSQAELARVARLTTMGELAASLAHEINQPLAAIVTNGDAALRWLDRDKPDLEEARRTLLGIVRDGKRAGGVVRGLRALVKRSEPERIQFDINDAIDEMLALTRSELQRHGVVLHTNLSAGDRPVFGDRVQLQQVLLNLIMNGIEAMKAVPAQTRELTVSSALAEAGHVLVAIEDTGTGLDPTIAERIFEPFFTTKSDGLGMGLSICRSIVEAHGGRLWASPRTPHGTALRFIIPIGTDM